MMPNIQKRILLIHTGGTLGMEGDDHLEPGHYASALVEQLPEYAGFADIDSTILCNLDSSDVGPAQWRELALTIARNRAQYDGFIVIHGTDTMPYTAAALSFALEGLDKPVVITGAQRPMGALRNDARRNLADAIEVSTLPIPEVSICFDGVLLRGCRSCKINTRAYHAFDSPGCEPLARLGVDITLAKHIRYPSAPFRCCPNFDANVIVLHVTPGIKSGTFMRLIDGEPCLDGIVLVPFGVGTIPCADGDLMAFLKRANDSGIDILVANAASGKIDLPLYENSNVLRNAGAISGGEIRLEAALVKLMHACATYRDRAERIEYLKYNIAGEMG